MGSDEPPLEDVGSFLTSWVREVIRYDEVAVILLNELTLRHMEARLAGSTALRQGRGCWSLI